MLAVIIFYMPWPEHLLAFFFLIIFCFLNSYSSYSLSFILASASQDERAGFEEKGGVTTEAEMGLRASQCLP